MISLGRRRLGLVEDVVEALEASAAGALLLVQNTPATVSDVVVNWLRYVSVARNAITLASLAVWCLVSYVVGVFQY
jgi:hypothetical protein